MAKREPRGPISRCALPLLPACHPWAPANAGSRSASEALLWSVFLAPSPYTDICQCWVLLEGNKSAHSSPQCTWILTPCVRLRVCVEGVLAPVCLFISVISLALSSRAQMPLLHESGITLGTQRTITSYIDRLKVLSHILKIREYLALPSVSVSIKRILCFCQNLFVTLLPARPKWNVSYLPRFRISSRYRTFLPWRGSDLEVLSTNEGSWVPLSLFTSAGLQVFQLHLNNEERRYSHILCSTLSEKSLSSSFILPTRSSDKCTLNLAMVCCQESGILPAWHLSECSGFRYFVNIGALDHSALRVIMKIVVIWRLSWLRRTEMECVALSLYIFFFVFASFCFYVHNPEAFFSSLNSYS